MEKNNRIKYVKVAGHLLFLVGVLLFFRYNSFLRPLALGELYKEYGSALMVLFMLYLNYWIIIPLFFLKKRFSLFAFFSVSSILLTTVSEMLLVLPNIRMCFPLSFSVQEIHVTLVKCSFLIGLRNTAFFLFFFMLKIIENERDTLKKERMALAQNKGFICVSSGKDTLETICISDIVYIVHERNYTYIRTLNGKQYSQYISLSNMENILPDKLFLRINKHVLIPVSRIVRYSQDHVTISYGDPAHEMIFPVSEKYVPDMKAKIASYDGLNERFDGLNKKKMTEKVGLKVLDLEDFMPIISQSKELETICRMIAKDPSVTIKKLADKLQVSSKTIERKIKLLKEQGVLQHNGAKKNGEYVFSPAISNNIIKWLNAD